MHSYQPIICQTLHMDESQTHHPRAGDGGWVGYQNAGWFKWMEDYQEGMGDEHRVVCLARLLASCTEESYLRRAQHSTGLGEGIGSSDEAHRIKLKQQVEDYTQCVATELTDLADRYTEPTLRYLQRAFNC